MSTTDQRSGFRLPWVSEPDASATDEPDSPIGAETGMSEETATNSASDAGVEVAPVTPIPVKAAATTGRPNPLMAELIRAMQGAASTSRDESLTRLSAEAKTQVEAIHAQSADEGTDLQKRADADIASIRDWSKAEMARIREETDRRISARRDRLAREVEDHAALVEQRIDKVQAAVAAFESRMNRFFELLLAETDPARFATLAGQMPEPPVLAAVGPNEDGAKRGDSASTADPSLSAEVAAAAEAEAMADLDAAGVVAEDAGTPTEGEDHPVPVFSEDNLAVRLAALRAVAPADEAATQSRLVVTGLVSVASIAGFKRALGRVEGVTSVGVTSGPDGEFVFLVQHAPGADVAAAIPALSGFEAELVQADGETLHISAHDRDGDA